MVSVTLSMSRCGFNPRARTGRDVDSTQQMLAARGFNPRARTGRD